MYLVGFQTDKGRVRQHNEDNCRVFFNPILGAMVALADGMGGEKGGAQAAFAFIESASSEFENLLRNHASSETVDKQKSWKQVFRNAQLRMKDFVTQDSSLQKMGTTGVLAWFNSDKLHYYWIGDSRLYRYRDGDLKQLTKDHSLVQQLLDTNSITPEQAKNHPRKNVLLRALGPQAVDPEPESKDIALEKGDIFLLCSDGLYNEVSEEAICKFLKQYTSDPLRKKDIEQFFAKPLGSPKTASKPSSIQKYCNALIKQANENGGHDNITVALCEVVDIEKYAKSRWSLANKKKIYFLAFVLLLAVGFSILLFTMGQKTPTHSLKKESPVEKQAIKKQKSQNKKNQSPLDKKQEKSK